MKRVLHFFQNKYPLFLFIVVLVSYGQMLFMFPWQDDHTIFFKLEHIADKAGFFGYGPIGQGGYKYIITPHLLISKLFGFNIPIYYLFGIIFYFLAAFTIYKVISVVVDKKSGRIAGFLFACGFIASDGFVRIFNSIATSSSVILISLLTLGYWKFYKTNKIRWYFSAILFYLMATEFIKIRTHYLIAAVIFFEIIFLAFRKFPRSIITSIIRLIPFASIFYYFFILYADSRTSEVKDFILGILKGDLYLLYGWISSIGHIVFPDWLTGIFSNNIKLGYLSTFVISAVILYILVKRRNTRLVALLCFFIFPIWYFLSSHIFKVPQLNIGRSEYFIAFLGGVVLIFILIILKILKGEKQRLFLFFLSWMLINIAAYSAYSPLVTYNSIQRYLAHSLFAISISFAVLFSALSQKKNKFSKIGIFLILLWGIGNLVSSVNYQRDIVVKRSVPEKNFYSQLKLYVPKLNKGDILYFDVADNSRQTFADFFSVASMPEETAIAWQYRIDRYDIRRVTSFDDLVSLIKAGGFGDINDKPLKLGNIYSFFYSQQDGLINTTNSLAKIFHNNSKFIDIPFKQTGFQINLDKPIDSVIPSNFKITIVAKLPDLLKISFPYVSNKKMQGNTISLDQNLRKLAFVYKNFRDNLRKTALISTTSDWQENLHKYLLDGNDNTVWRPDRITWHEGKESLTLDLGRHYEIDRFVWQNAYANNTPTEYAVDISLDNKNWTEVKHIADGSKRIDPTSLQVIQFSPQKARFVRMRLLKSLNDDSPGISEVWALPSNYDSLDINEAESFLREPFGYVPDKESFSLTIASLNGIGRANVYSMSDKSDAWTTDFGSSIGISYNGQVINYNVQIPAGGTHIKALKFDHLEIPGTINVTNISLKQ